MPERLDPPPPPKGYVNPDNHLIDMTRIVNLSGVLYNAYEQLERSEQEGLAPAPHRHAEITESEWIHMPISRAPRRLRDRGLKAMLLLDVVTTDGIARPMSHIIRDAFAVHQQLRLTQKLNDELPYHFFNNTALLWRPMTPSGLFKIYMNRALIHTVDNGSTAFTRRPIIAVREPDMGHKQATEQSSTPKVPQSYFYTVDPPEHTIPLITIDQM